MNYRENAKPECPCDWCQSSVWQRQIAYVVRVWPRLFVLLSFAGGVEILAVAAEGGVRGCMAKPDPPSECRDSVDIVSASSTPISCSHGARMSFTPVFNNPGQITVVCKCPDGDAPAMNASAAPSASAP